MIPVLAKYYDKGVFGNACNKYMRQAVDCRTKRQLFDLMLDVNSVCWIASAVAAGTITAEDIASDFAGFVNGRYIRTEDGYTSALYIKQGNVDIDTTVSLCIDCKNITIGPTKICEVHSTSPSNVACKGICRYIEYLNSGKVRSVNYGRL